MHGSCRQEVSNLPYLVSCYYSIYRYELIVDDDNDITTTFEAAIEDIDTDRRIEVYTSNDPVAVLSEFKPELCDLLLVDINMPHMNGYYFFIMLSTEIALLFLHLLRQYRNLLVQQIVWSTEGSSTAPLGVSLVFQAVPLSPSTFANILRIPSSQQVFTR